MTRLKAIDFARAKAKRELDLVVEGAAKRTAAMGLAWTTGKIIRNCSNVAVSVQDMVAGGTITHPVPLYLTLEQMQNEARMMERYVMVERKKAGVVSGDEC